MKIVLVHGLIPIRTADQSEGARAVGVDPTVIAARRQHQSYIDVAGD